MVHDSRALVIFAADPCKPYRSPAIHNDGSDRYSSFRRTVWSAGAGTAPSPQADEFFRISRFRPFLGISPQYVQIRQKTAFVTIVVFSGMPWLHRTTMPQAVFDGPKQPHLIPKLEYLSQHLVRFDLFAPVYTRHCFLSPQFFLPYVLRNEPQSDRTLGAPEHEVIVSEPGAAPFARHKLLPPLVTVASRHPPGSFASALPAHLSTVPRGSFSTASSRAPNLANNRWISMICTGDMQDKICRHASQTTPFS